MGGIAWLLIIILRLFWGAFTDLNPTVAAAILAAVTTVLVSVISVLIAKHLEQRNNVLNELRAKKAPVYEELIEFIFRIIYGEKMGLDPMPDTEIVSKFAGITRKVLVWGSDDVVQSLYTFRRHSSAGDGATALMVMSVEQMLLAIRKDLGHSNKGLTPGKLLGTFVNDLHKLFEPK